MNGLTLLILWEILFLMIYDPGSVSLTLAEKRSIIPPFLDFTTERREKEYVFTASDGSEYSLNDILFSLKPKYSNKQPL